LPPHAEAPLRGVVAEDANSRPRSRGGRNGCGGWAGVAVTVGVELIGVGVPVWTDALGVRRRKLGEPVAGARATAHVLAADGKFDAVGGDVLGALARVA